MQIKLLTNKPEFHALEMSEVQLTFTGEATGHHAMHGTLEAAVIERLQGAESSTLRKRILESDENLSDTDYYTKLGQKGGGKAVK